VRLVTGHSDRAKAICRRRRHEAGWCSSRSRILFSTIHGLAWAWNDSRARGWRHCGRVAEFAGEFLHDGGVLPVPRRQVANGDDLHAERRFAQERTL